MPSEAHRWLIDSIAEGERSTFTIEIDRAGTATALGASKAQVDAMRRASSRRDTGGDIKL